MTDFEASRANRAPTDLDGLLHAVASRSASSSRSKARTAIAAAWLSLVLLLLAGCSAAPTAEPPATVDAPAAAAVAPGPTAAAVAAVPGPAALAPIVLTDSREGVVQYRLASDGAPVSAYTGDPHSFCLRLPEGVLAVDFTLTWDDPRPLLLEFQNDHDEHTTHDHDIGKAVQATSPSMLHVDAPDDGVWQVWVGFDVDAMHAWHLDIAWTVPANLTLDMIEDQGFCP